MKRPVSQGSEQDSERRSPKSTQGVGKLLMDLVTRAISSFTSGGCVEIHAATLIPYEEVRHSGHSRRVVVVSASADFLLLDKRRTGVHPLHWIFLQRKGCKEQQVSRTRRFSIPQLHWNPHDCLITQ